MKTKEIDNSVIYRNKKYWEYYALLTIREFLYKNVNDKHGRIKDKPDIRIKFNNKTFGIEVTRLIEEEEANSLSTVNKYFGKNLNGTFIKEETSKTRASVAKRISVFDETAIYTSTIVDMNTIEYLLDELIENKIRKFLKYKKFQFNCLYIHAQHYPIEIETVTHLIERKINIPYDYIIVNNYEGLLIYKENKYKQYYSFNDDVIKVFKEKSIKYTRRILKKKNNN